MMTDKEFGDLIASQPSPGSKEAIQRGCKCPVLDNSHGKGYMGQEGVFVYSSGCSIHPWPELKNK